MKFVARVAFGRWGENPALDAMRVRALCELLTQVNEEILRGDPRIPDVYEAGIKRGLHYLFVPTRGGDDDWCDVLQVLAQGYGDCEDLAAYRAAVLRVRHNIAARCDFEVTKVNGRDEYHIFVRHPDGRKEDPSRVLGLR